MTRREWCAGNDSRIEEEVGLDRQGDEVAPFENCRDRDAPRNAIGTESDSEILLGCNVNGSAGHLAGQESRPR